MDAWMRDALKPTRIEVVTRSGFRLSLMEAGTDKAGNRLWREVASKLGR